MFYRYEAKDPKTGEYEGIFSFFNPDHRRYFNRFLKEPKWYEKNPNLPSRCWFTEEGYQKYHTVMEEIISWAGIKDVRLLQKEKLDYIACKGKIQCIEADGWKPVYLPEVKKGDVFLLNGELCVASEDTQWVEGPILHEYVLDWEIHYADGSVSVGWCTSKDFPGWKVIVFTNKVAEQPPCKNSQNTN